MCDPRGQRPAIKGSAPERPVDREGKPGAWFDRSVTSCPNPCRLGVCGVVRLPIHRRDRPTMESIQYHVDRSRLIDCNGGTMAERAGVCQRAWNRSSWGRSTGHVPRPSNNHQAEPAPSSVVRGFLLACLIACLLACFLWLSLISLITPDLHGETLLLLSSVPRSCLSTYTARPHCCALSSSLPADRPTLDISP